MAKGVVERVGEKEGRFGKMYSFKLRDSETWYGLKSFKPQFREGNLIEFEARQNDKGYWDADGKSVRVLEATVAAAPAARDVARGATMSKDDYWKRREERDLVNDQLRNIGAARNTAIAFVDLLAKYEAVKLPAKQSEKAAALLEAVEHYREQFMSEVEKEPDEELDEKIPFEPNATAAQSEWN